MIINIDLDGTVYPFEPRFHKFCEGFTGKKFPEITQWDIHSCWGITKEKFNELFRDFIMHKMFREGDPYPDAIEVISRLRESHTINLVTARSYQYDERFDTQVQYAIRVDTSNWVSQIPHDGLFFTKNKSCISGLLLDDYIPNLESKGELESICYTQPWNKEWKWDRVNNWLEFETLIKSSTELPIIIGG